MSTSRFRSQLIRVLQFNAILAGAKIGKDIIYHHKIKAAQLDPNPENNPSLEHKHQHQIILQAYRDMGFKGPVYVQFEGFGYYSTNFIHAKKGRAAIVYAPNPVFEHLSLNAEFKKIEDSILYSIAGHEAAHMTNHDSLSFRLPLFSLAIACIKNPIGLFAFYLALFHGPLNQVIEFKADIASAKKLNTAQIAREFFSISATLEENVNKNFYARFLSTHPLSQTREKYLSKLAEQEKEEGRTPRLFQSATYQKILEERSQQKKPKPSRFRLI